MHSNSVKEMPVASRLDRSDDGEAAASNQPCSHRELLTPLRQDQGISPDALAHAGSWAGPVPFRPGSDVHTHCCHVRIGSPGTDARTDVPRPPLHERIISEDVAAHHHFHEDTCVYSSYGSRKRRRQPSLDVSELRFQPGVANALHFVTTFQSRNGVDGCGEGSVQAPESSKMTATSQPDAQHCEILTDTVLETSAHSGVHTDSRLADRSQTREVGNASGPPLPPTQSLTVRAPSKRARLGLMLTGGGWEWGTGPRPVALPAARPVASSNLGAVPVVASGAAAAHRPHAHTPDSPGIHILRPPPSSSAYGTMGTGTAGGAVSVEGGAAHGHHSRAQTMPLPPSPSPSSAVPRVVARPAPRPLLSALSRGRGAGGNRQGRGVQGRHTHTHSADEEASMTGQVGEGAAARSHTLDMFRVRFARGTKPHDGPLPLHAAFDRLVWNFCMGHLGAHVAMPLPEARPVRDVFAGYGLASAVHGTGAGGGTLGLAMPAPESAPPTGCPPFFPHHGQVRLGGTPLSPLCAGDVSLVLAAMEGRREAILGQAAACTAALDMDAGVGVGDLTLTQALLGCALPHTCVLPSPSGQGQGIRRAVADVAAAAVEALQSREGGGGAAPYGHPGRTQGVNLPHLQPLPLLSSDTHAHALTLSMTSSAPPTPFATAVAMGRAVGAAAARVSFLPLLAGVQASRIRQARTVAPRPRAPSLTHTQSSDSGASPVEADGEGASAGVQRRQEGKAVGIGTGIATGKAVFDPSSVTLSRLLAPSLPPPQDAAAGVDMVYHNRRYGDGDTLLLRGILALAESLESRLSLVVSASASAEGRGGGVAEAEVEELDPPSDQDEAPSPMSTSSDSDSTDDVDSEGEGGNADETVTGEEGLARRSRAARRSTASRPPTPAGRLYRRGHGHAMLQGQADSSSTGREMRHTPFSDDDEEEEEEGEGGRHVPSPTSKASDVGPAPPPSPPSSASPSQASDESESQTDNDTGSTDSWLDLDSEAVGAGARDSRASRARLVPDNEVMTGSPSGSDDLAMESRLDELCASPEAELAAAAYRVKRSWASVPVLAGGGGSSAKLGGAHLPLARQLVTLLRHAVRAYPTEAHMKRQMAAASSVMAAAQAEVRRAGVQSPSAPQAPQLPMPFEQR